MAKFGEQTRLEISALIEEMLRDEENDLNVAFLKAGDDPLALAISVKVDVGSNGENEIDAVMTYTVEKRKIKSRGRANEDGNTLFSRDELKGKGSLTLVQDRRGPVGRAPRYVGLGG